MGNTRWTVSTNNVNFSFKAAGTNAAHRLSSVPILEMGQLALKTANWGEKGEPALFDRNHMSKYFPFHTRKEIYEHLEKQSTHPSNFSLFLNKYFKILINNSDCKQNPGARANGPKEVC